MGMGRGGGRGGPGQQMMMGGGRGGGGRGGGGASAPSVGIAAVRVEFKRGRVELFRVDDPALAARCASFQGPYHMWVECSPGEDVGLVVTQVGKCVHVWGVSG
jgi:hypothetical protein